MAQAVCGQIWSWDSPMWCSGKKDEEEKKDMCLTCPWYKGNKHETEDFIG